MTELDEASNTAGALVQSVTFDVEEAVALLSDRVRATDVDKGAASQVAGENFFALLDFVVYSKKIRGLRQTFSRDRNPITKACSLESYSRRIEDS